MRVVIFAERVRHPEMAAGSPQTDLKYGLDRQAFDPARRPARTSTSRRSSSPSNRMSSPIRVLVTSDLASEGVNLHAQCHELIHFDIPWSLIRIEQRNGRIDRYGQKHPPPITTLLLSPHPAFAGDLKVLQKLIEKEHEAHTALGDSASLMGEYDVNAEEDAIREVLAGKQASMTSSGGDAGHHGGGVDRRPARAHLRGCHPPGPATDDASTRDRRSPRTAPTGGVPAGRTE